ncbi:type II secretion system F family protein [Streptomyces sp. RS10V-4]|uniref:type II secretion system F family protein n=1 Tax=Streptomyces rhizoryzae TaxID=2932493 RepID=UPI00200301A5|nr:type II secretion system F family protein [Streptomyces rhizoryzae]MCK7624166.1 type II secretion system F family protein [Streptomyces rhizoryzae]
MAAAAVAGCAVLLVPWARRARALRRRTAAVLGDGAAGSAQGRGAALREWIAGRAGGGEGRRWRFGRCGEAGAELWCLPAGLALGLLGRSVLPVLAAPVALVAVRRWLAARDRRRAADRRAAAVIRFCGAVAGELRAGRQPDRALVAAGAPGLGEAGPAVLAAARYGGDVPGALRAAARTPGAEGLAAAAACWQVAVEGGAGLARGLERIAAGLAARRDQREELHAQLAGPRATALMLALLPAGGLLMGGALGADPLGVLLHTPAGWGCLLVGGLLEWGGVVWTARIVADASDEPAAPGHGSGGGSGSGGTDVQGKGRWVR